jgi:hypothetical protein
MNGQLNLGENDFASMANEGREMRIFNLKKGGITIDI